MRPVPIPDHVVWANAERKVFTAPGGDLLDDAIAPVEAVVDFPTNPTTPVISVRCALEDGDLENLTAGGHVWVSFYGGLPPFSVDTTAPDTVVAISGPAKEAAITEQIRGAFAEVALAGWKARDMNVGDDRMLEVLGTQLEQLVQSIARQAVA